VVTSPSRSASVHQHLQRPRKSDGILGPSGNNAAAAAKNNEARRWSPGFAEGNFVDLVRLLRD
jgi:hypothetical protein